MTEDLLALAIDTARRAGELLAERFGSTPQGVGSKTTPTDLVSDADRESEALILDALSGARPHDGVLAEEGASRDSMSGYTWVVDPLDGTVNYLFGIPVWSVSIALQDTDGTVVGVVHDPNRDETFAAVRGAGAALNDSPIHASTKTDLTQALIGTGFAYDARVRKEQAETAARIIPMVRDIRRAGSAALDLCSVACGRLDGFYEATMEAWDKGAGVLVAREAGAIVTDLAAPLGFSNGVIAANPKLHTALTDIVLG